MSDPNARLDDLLAAMTLDEKLGQLSMIAVDMAVSGPARVRDPLAAVRGGRAGSLLNLWGAAATREAQRIALEETRLHIPVFFGFDILHGHRTIFPVPLAEAAAFDPELWRRTARCAAEEAAEDGLHLTFAPSLDVCRDPRWGRIVEGPGEDSWVAEQFADAKVRGFQGGTLAAPGSIAATAKHFAAYGAVAGGRDYAPVDISERTYREVYLPPFRAAVAAGVAAIMPAFTDLAGVPLTADAGSLRDLLRTRWGFAGVVISDFHAIPELIAHGVAADIPEAAALALRAGVDIDMMGDAYRRGLPAALERGSVALADIDASVRRVLALKAALGLFDDPYGCLPAATPDRHAGRRALAREAAHRAIVLLTNRAGTLPLRRDGGTLALLGPLADAPGEMLGPWCAAGTAQDAVGVLQGLRAALPRMSITFLAGAASARQADDVAAAAAAAHRADTVVLCLGETRAMSGEAASRGDPGLPDGQEELARAVLAAGKPVIVLLTCGRPLVLPSWLVKRAGAILATWFLGSEAGHAVANVLTGAVSPSGRLPVSWPAHAGQIPVHFGARPTGRPADAAAHYSSKYIDLPIEPMFPFGHGLAYTTFTLDAVRVDRDQIGGGEAAIVTVEVANDGSRAGRDTVFLFTRDPVASVARPLLELRGVAQVMVAPGGRETVRFTLAADALAFLGRDLRPVLEPGLIEILVGHDAARARLLRTTIRVV